jgi:hypothetical protein
MEAVVASNIGICSTCNHLADCAYRFRNGAPIWFCEEFDDSVEPARAPMSDTLALEPEPNGKEKFLGLCMNCELRHTCAFPKPEGGVWHCEEYR